MSVLRNGTCQKDRERYDSSSKKSYEDHVRTGLRNDSDKGRKYDHQGCIVADPMLYVDMLKSESENNKDSEGPCECSRKMLLDDMLPEVLFYKVVRGEKQDEQHDYAETCKQHVHPVLAEEIDRFLHALRLVEMTSAFAMAMMGMSVMVMSVTRHCEGFARGNLFTFMNMTLMSGVVMSQHACSQRSDEQCQSHKHADAFPSEMPQIATLRSQ